MNVLSSLLLILACLCFLADALTMPAGLAARVKLTPLGLFLYVVNALVLIVPRQ